MHQQQCAFVERRFFDDADKDHRLELCWLESDRVLNLSINCIKERHVTNLRDTTIFLTTLFLIFIFFIYILFTPRHFARLSIFYYEGKIK